MPVKFDEESLIWVAGDQPLKDSSFLSSKILDLCRDLPIFWLRPTYPKGNYTRIMFTGPHKSHKNTFITA